MWNKVFDVIYRPLYWLWYDVLGIEIFGVQIKSILFTLILCAVVFRIFIMPFIRGRFTVGSDNVHAERGLNRGKRVVTYAYRKGNSNKNINNGYDIRRANGKSN